MPLFASVCVDSPVLEGVVNDGFQHKSVTDVRRATEMEHVYAPQGRVSVTQATRSKYEEERGTWDSFQIASAN